MATAQLMGIPSGKAGTRYTLNTMRRLANQAKTSMPVRQTALCIVQRLAPKDYRAEAEALHNWVRDCIRYVRDVYDVETIATPKKTLEIGQGDCDDKATLLAAMLLSIGHPARFVAIGYNGLNFDHVYVETLVDGEWLAMETTEPWDMGASHATPVDKMVMSV